MERISFLTVVCRKEEVKTHSTPRLESWHYSTTMHSPFLWQLLSPFPSLPSSLSPAAAQLLAYSEAMQLDRVHPVKEVAPKPTSPKIFSGQSINSL